jgi:signal transduction histidine kinase
MRTLYEPRHHEYELHQAQAQAAQSAQSIESTDTSLDAMEVRKSERRRLAHDLHDTVVQPLTALLISMETVSQPGDAEISPAQIIAWKALAREAVQSLRSTMSGLRAAPSEDVALPDLLRHHLVPQVQSRGLPIELQCAAWPAELPSDWTTSLYLTVREALMNVEKHAHATQVMVRLRADASRLYITISDDGIGFAPKRGKGAESAATGGSGFGVAAMRDRVRHLGGRLTITSGAARGARIDIVIPRQGQHQGQTQGQAHGQPHGRTQGQARGQSRMASAYASSAPSGRVRSASGSAR